LEVQILAYSWYSQVVYYAMFDATWRPLILHLKEQLPSILIMDGVKKAAYNYS